MKRAVNIETRRDSLATPNAYWVGLRFAQTKLRNNLATAHEAVSLLVFIFRFAGKKIWGRYGSHIALVGS